MFDIPGLYQIACMGTGALGIHGLLEIRKIKIPRLIERPNKLKTQHLNYFSILSTLNRVF